MQPMTLGTACLQLEEKKAKAEATAQEHQREWGQQQRALAGKEGWPYATWPAYYLANHFATCALSVGLALRLIS